MHPNNKPAAHKRERLGLCVKCSYDLRGSNERCPECGTAFEEKVKQP